MRSLLILLAIPAILISGTASAFDSPEPDGNGLHTSATGISVPNSFSGNLSTTDKEDWFAFTATAGTYTFTLTGFDGTADDLDIILEDDDTLNPPPGNLDGPVGESQNFCCVNQVPEQFTVNLENNHTYYLKIIYFNSSVNPTSPYTMSVTKQGESDSGSIGLPATLLILITLLIGRSFLRR